MMKKYKGVALESWDRVALLRESDRLSAEVNALGRVRDTESSEMSAFQRSRLTQALRERMRALALVSVELRMRAHMD